MKAESNWKQVSGDKVSFIDLPYYVGFIGLIKNSLKIRRIINKALTPQSAIIYRVPSQTAMIATLGNKQQGYGLEVVGDPYDVFNSGITNTFFDKTLAFLSYLGLRSMAHQCLASCYVTTEYLQQRYPVKKGILSIGCSDIELRTECFIELPKVFTEPAKNLIFIGSFEQLYKGPDILIKAIAELLNQGKKYTVTIIGGGKYLQEMKDLALQYSCEEQLHFLGELPHLSVQKHLDVADVFIMPSRTEGLPRALMEAMARALPCITSRVGGIPELLEDKFMINENTPTYLAQAIDDLCNSIDLLNYASRGNLDKVQNYRHEILVKKRKDFYQKYYSLKKIHYLHD